jgi:hypothetical protein
MKSFARVAVLGVASVAMLKLFSAVFVPILGMMIGLIALTMKVAVVAAIAYFLWSFFGKSQETDEDAEAREMEEKIEIVVEEVVEDSPGDTPEEDAGSN